MIRAVLQLSILLATVVVLPAQDSAPFGAISFFANSCPAGWRAYENAQGRAIVPVDTGGNIGLQVGDALEPGEQPSHSHVGSVVLSLNGTTVREWPFDAGSRIVARWPGSPTPLQTTIERADSNLPLYRLTVCEKVGDTMGRAPTGIVFFFTGAACPTGWSGFAEAGGRVLTGAEAGRAPAPFGLTRVLDDGEDRLHNHVAEGDLELEFAVDTVWSGCSTCEGRWAYDEKRTYRGQAESASSGLPYIQLRACSKDASTGPSIRRVANAADFQSRPLAPGQIATLFGDDLGPIQGEGAVLAGDGAVAREVAGIQVHVDEFTAPLFFVRTDQINFQVPYEVAGRSAAQIWVTKDGNTGLTVESPVAAAAPALFAWSNDPTRVVAVHTDGSLNAAGNPAAPGQPIVLFATGGGQTMPPGQTGRPATQPFPTPIGDVQLRIGGELAVLDYAGAAPGFVGLIQINARMTAVSGRAAVSLQIGAASSQAEPALYASP